MKFIHIPGIFLFLLFIGTGRIHAQTNDLAAAKIVCTEKSDPIILKAVTVLHEEINKRSQIQLQVVKTLPKKVNTSLIVVGLESKLTGYTNQLAHLEITGKDGFKLLTLDDGKTILVAGNDSRGVLYGVGKLLRSLEMESGQIVLSGALKNLFNTQISNSWPPTGLPAKDERLRRVDGCSV